MTKYDIKYIIKKILIYSGVALILMFVNSCKAHALTQTVGINYYDTGAQVHGIQCNSNYCDTPVYNEANYIPPNIPTHEPLKGVGEGNFIFTFVVRNSSTPSNIISGVRLSNNSDIFQCEIGTTYTYNDNQSGVAIITANCPVNFKSGYGLKTITFERNGGSGVSLISWSKYGTFISKANVNVNVNQQQVADAIQASQTATIQAMEASSAIAHQDAQNAINQAHQDAQQAHTDSQNIYNSINNDNVDNQQSSDFFTNFGSTTNEGLQDLIKKPISIIDSFYNSCSPVVFDIPYFETTITLPCISSIQNNFTSVIFPIIKVIVNGLLCYRILLAFIDSINKLKDPNNSDLEVVDL